MPSRSPAPAKLDELADFKRFYRDHYAYVRAVLRRLGVDAVDDANQEVFITAYRRRDTFEPSRPVRPWLVGIARRVAFRARRGQQRSRRKRSALARHEASGPPKPAFDGQLEARQFLARFVAGLDDRHREVFVLGELEGRTGAEIARALDIGIDTAYARLRTSRARLKQALLAVEPRTRPPPARVARGFALLLPRLAAPDRFAGWWSGVSTRAVVSGMLAVVSGALAVGVGLVGSSEWMDGAGASARAQPHQWSGPVQAESPRDDGEPMAASRAPLVDVTQEAKPVSVSESAGTPSRSTVARARSSAGVPSLGTAVDLAEQARRLAAARVALDAGRPGDALDVLRIHAREFPASPLAEARDALRVEVLCAQGKRAQARGEAKILLRRHPGSNLARRAATVCSGSSPP